MKNLILLFAVFFLSFCCNAKQVIEKSKKNNAQLEEAITAEKTVVVEHSEILETAEEVKTDSIYFISDAMYVMSHDRWNTLLEKHVSNEGNVNYKGFKKDQSELKKYIKSLSEALPNEKLSKERKLAYWINAYNAMTVDLIIRNYPVKSIKDIKDPWDQRLWKLGNKWYNLNEIEHQILRKMNEPRIHFAIVCASFSCPKLQNEAFTHLNLEDQLTKATKDFLADPNRNNIATDNIKISKIFKWFSNDFNQNGSLIEFLNQYSDVQISSKAKKSYKEYNWSLNE